MFYSCLHGFSLGSLVLLLLLLKKPPKKNKNKNSNKKNCQRWREVPEIDTSPILGVFSSPAQCYQSSLASFSNLLKDIFGNFLSTPRHMCFDCALPSSPPLPITFQIREKWQYLSKFKLYLSHIPGSPCNSCRRSCSVLMLPSASTRQLLSASQTYDNGYHSFFSTLPVLLLTEEMHEWLYESIFNIPLQYRCNHDPWSPGRTAPFGSACLLSEASVSCSVM